MASPVWGDSMNTHAGPTSPLSTPPRYTMSGSDKKDSAAERAIERKTDELLRTPPATAPDGVEKMRETNRRSEEVAERFKQRGY